MQRVQFMLKDVIIDFEANESSGKTGDGIKFTTDGLYTFEDNVGCVSYEESEVTGMEGTRTSLFFMPDSVIVDRDGSITSRMIFRPGEKNDFLYNTPYGRAVMQIDTKSVRQNFGFAGGQAEVEYVINVDHTVFSKHRFTINVRDTGEKAHG